MAPDLTIISLSSPASFGICPSTDEFPLLLTAAQIRNKIFGTVSRHRMKGDFVLCLRGLLWVGRLATWILSLVPHCVGAPGVLTQFPLLHPMISEGLASAAILRCEVWGPFGDLLRGPQPPSGVFKYGLGSKLRRRWGQLGALWATKMGRRWETESHKKLPNLEQSHPRALLQGPQISERLSWGRSYRHGWWGQRLDSEENHRFLFRRRKSSG